MQAKGLFGDRNEPWFQPRIHGFRLIHGLRKRELFGKRKKSMPKPWKKDEKPWEKKLPLGVFFNPWIEFHDNPATPKTPNYRLVQKMQIILDNMSPQPSLHPSRFTLDPHHLTEGTGGFLRSWSHR